MTVDAYMVEDAEGETHIASASDIQIDHEDWSEGAERFALMVERYGDRDYVEPCTVLAALELHRSIDMGLRTADGTALEVIGEVCDTLIEPLVRWMSRHGLAQGSQHAWERVGYIEALCEAREWPADAWDGSGWFDAIAGDGPPDYNGYQEPIYGQGCEQDMCEDTWSDCGGVVDVSSDAGMIWLWRVVEDYTR